MALPKLLLVILDGASARALAEADTPYLDACGGEFGLKPMTGQAPVPTITYGNHACIMTGRRAGGPGGHGIVGNLFRDPASGEILNLDDVPPDQCLEAPSLFEQLAPLGVRGAAVAEPVTRGSVFSSPMMPYFNLDAMERDTRAADKTLDVIAQVDPDFIAVNFLSVDAAGERFGPESDEYMHILYEADLHINALMMTWKKTVRGPVNLLVTSDHGMHAVNRPVNTDAILRGADVRADVAASHRAAHIYLRNRGDLARAMDALQDSGAFSTVLRHENLAPLSLDHPRSGDIFVLAAPGVELQKPGLRGSHGASQPEETEVPIIFAGPDWPDVLKRNQAFMDRPTLSQLAGLVTDLFRTRR
jgi:predicted AlkP superfamily pyrophosphatase or phosphodiesterase